MELEHIKNINNLKAVQDLNLPIKKFEYNIDKNLLTFNDYDDE